jgi:hypothetical protein
LNRQLLDEGGFKVGKAVSIESGRGRAGIRNGIALASHPFKVSLPGRAHRFERVANRHTVGRIRRMERAIRAGRISVEHNMSPVHFCPACSRILATVNFEISLPSHQTVERRYRAGADLNPPPVGLRYTTASSTCFANGHLLPFRWSSNSLRNFFTKPIVGIAAASPSGQKVRPIMFSARY